MADLAIESEATTPIAPAALAQALLAAYQAAGASPEALTAARLLLARGRVFEAELDAVNTLDDTDDGDRNLLACLDGIAHLIADGEPLTPLVTVTETGLVYNNCHPAVRVTYGPIDWHPRVMVTLTDEQVRALGVEPNIASAYLISGYVMAVDSSDAPIGGTAWPDEFTFDFTYQSPVEMPRQRTVVLPIACLSDGSMSPDERRRENRLRRTAGRQGLKLKKMRGVLPARSAGPYWLQNAIGTAVAGQPWSRRGLSLDEIEAELGQRQSVDAPNTDGAR